MNGKLLIYSGVFLIVQFQWSNRLFYFQLYLIAISFSWGFDLIPLALALVLQKLLLLPLQPLSLETMLLWAVTMPLRAGTMPLCSAVHSSLWFSWVLSDTTSFSELEHLFLAPLAAHPLSSRK